MSASQEGPEPANDPAAMPIPRRDGPVGFVLADHRYVFLGTSVIALAGMRLSMQPRSHMSFLAGVYVVEVGMYYALLAFLAVAGVALANKLLRWRDYARTSPFVRPAARRAERIASCRAASRAIFGESLSPTV